MGSSLLCALCGLGPQRLITRSDRISELTGKIGLELKRRTGVAAVSFIMLGHGTSLEPSPLDPD